MLYLVKTPPTKSTEFLMEALGEGKEITRFNLYESTDYDKLVELIFAEEECVSWW